jgi:hypothetical protein
MIRAKLDAQPSELSPQLRGEEQGFRLNRTPFVFAVHPIAIAREIFREMESATHFGAPYLKVREPFREPACANSTCAD